MLAIINLGNLGNIQSVLGACQRLGLPVTVATRPTELDAARAVLLPGVGAFAAGMARLRESGFVDALRRHVLGNCKPLLGICLGMQLLAQEGLEHGVHQGLGFLPGRVVPLPVGVPNHRIPNMGWCDVAVRRQDSRLFSGCPETGLFYFAHSFYVECDDASDVVATIDYGGPIPAAVERGNLFGVQFHPEKSQEAGLNLLHAFWHNIS